ncbi:MAG TPA: TetR/AcrR family transcriptional regulator [Solirubrobacterales bacterium]|nr:TetR/AcrR family transcriptional regulator [Solirubrobacterales bacterium]
MAETKTSKRQEQVYEVAAQLFHEKGYDKASVRDIAEAIGLQKGSVYHYFESKEDLLFQLLKDGHLDLLAGLEEVTESGAGPLEQLMDLTHRHCLYVAENSLIVGLFLNHFRSLTGVHREYIQRDRDRYEAGWRRIFIKGQESGEIRSDLDPVTTINGIFGLTNGIHQWYREGEQLSAEEIGRQYAGMVSRAISAAVADGKR